VRFMRPSRCLLASIVAAASLLIGCSETGAPTLEAIAGTTMGTTYHIKYVVQESDLIAKATLENDIARILDDIDLQMSTYREDSEISRFNQSRSDEWVPVSADIATVVSEAQRVSELSGGAFDITVGPLVKLWGFGPDLRAPGVPTDSAINAAREKVGFRKLEVRQDPPAIRKTNPLVEIDLGAIAPGYAVDRLAGYLKSVGLRDYLVELGGEVRATGRRPDGHPWRVAIEEPTNEYGEIQTLVELNGEGLSTSGSYRNFFEIGGRRYSHEIDPHTGWPASHKTVAVAVVAPTTMTADALSTAMVVLGEEEGLDVAKRNNLAVYFIISAVNGLRVEQTYRFAHYQVNSRINK